MSRFATVCEIAGVVFTGCRANVVEAVGTLSNYGGSMDYGNDHEPHAQVFNRGKKGVPFGIKFASLEQSKIEQVRAAIEAAMAANTTFVVEINDSIYSINANCIRAFDREWIEHPPEHSESWMKDTTIWFTIKTGVV